MQNARRNRTALYEFEQLVMKAASTNIDIEVINLLWIQLR